MSEKFHGSFTQQAPIPQDAIDAAVEVMRSGRLHRYNVADGEAGEVALLEKEFAQATGARFCLAVASGGYALATALRAAGARPGEIVLTNAFTLAPVPGAIAAVGCVPHFVEITSDLVIDTAHLEAQISRLKPRFLMLSHMRGHVGDMDELMALCGKHGVSVIEDCAHTMGARWNGVVSGRHGRVACYSTQTYKHINSGEGGLIISDDPDLMARATLLSGSYMLYERHIARPELAFFEQPRLDTPNISGRMDHLRAAVLRPQLARLDALCEAWNARYRAVETGLRGVNGLRLIERAPKEDYVGSSIQFLLPDFRPLEIEDLVARCLARGVELKWFGTPEPTGFTSRHSSWRYAPQQHLPRTDRLLDGLMDMRLPLTFSLADCDLIARIIRQEVTAS